MTMQDMLLLAVPAFLAAFFLTWCVRRYALRAQMIDVPGARSSHQVPTPRGGGLAISLCVLGGTALLWLIGRMPDALAGAVMAGGVPVTVVGWLDDRRGLPPLWRALVYFAAAIAVMCILEGGWSVRVPVAALAIAWLINLYNFMDGTDGLAGVQALSAASFAGVLFAAAGDPAAASLCVLLAAACTGFLLWNWPPARIFMGDTGSCFIGCMLGVLAATGSASGAVPLAAWLILLSVFIGDATLTLLRRLMQRERWYSPHRTHAYQLLVQAGMTHRQLAISLLILNCLLGALALWSWRDTDNAPAIAGTVLVVVTLGWCVIVARLLPRT